MQLARRLWIAAACTLALVLGSSAQAQSTKLLPNDTEMIVTFNLQQILKSEVVKENKVLFDAFKDKFNEQLDDKDVGKWLKKASFDPFKDLTSITFAVPGARNPEQFFTLLEGNFDADKIEAAAIELSKEKGGNLKVIKIGGAKAFEITPEDKKPVYVGILSKKMMIACADKADFAEAVARIKGDKSAKFTSPVFKSLMETVNSKQSISIVATSNMMLKAADKAPEGNPQVQQAIQLLKQLDGVSAAVTVQKNIDLQLGVNTKDADTASKYAGFGNLAVGALKAKLGEGDKDDPKIKAATAILNTVRVTSQGPNLVVRGQISFDTLTELLKLIPKQ